MIENSIENPMVSIQMLAYNHGKYIKQALDSIIMQNVNFSYEIVVGEDCSQDNTREILLQYKKKYPDKIKLVLHDINVGMFENGNSIRRVCLGKYVAICEGDDYWTDPNKLQKQVDFLENNDEFVGTAHKVKVVDENGNKKDGFNMSMYCNDEVYTLKHAEKGILPGQYASCVYRNILRDDNFALQLMEECRANEDAKTALLAVLNGDIYCFEEIMSHYRWVTNSGDSWSARIKKKNLFLYNYLSYQQLGNFAKKLKNVEMNYQELYLNFCYGSLIKWIKGPNKANLKIMIDVCGKYNAKSEMVFFIIKQLLIYPFRKLRSRSFF